MSEVHIRLAVGTVRLEYSGSRAFFERLVEPLVEAAYARGRDPAPSEALDEAVPMPSGPLFKPTSPQRFNQFVGQVGEKAATVDQRIMAFSFYLWNYERKEDFPISEIESFFRTVHEEPPDDMGARARDLADEKRFLEPGRGTDSWRLTSKGVNYVKNRLLGGAA